MSHPMSLPARRELLASTAPRYAKANKKLKQTILDEFTASTGYHRKYAIGLLKHYDPKTTKTKRRPLNQGEKRGSRSGGGSPRPLPFPNRT